MKEDNKNLIIGLLILALGGLGYVYFKKNNKDKAGDSGDAVLNGAVVPSSSASADTSKADKEKADKEKEAQEKANRERAEKETLDKANAIAKQLMNNAVTLMSVNASLFYNNSSSWRRELEIYQNQKSDLLYELSNLGYKWSYPNQFATKR
jgi:Cdc6-like AAA superfamily ATPase